MTQLHPPIERGDASIAGRLVEHRIAPGGSGKRRCVAILGDLKSVEAGAQHEHELVAQDLTSGAEFAFEVMTLAQQSRLAIGAAVAEDGNTSTTAASPPR